jgi:hypothetical protein
MKRATAMPLVSSDGASSLTALPPRILRDMARKVIEKHISPAQTQLLRVAEDSERELLSMWQPAIDGVA